MGWVGMGRCSAEVRLAEATGTCPTCGEPWDHHPAVQDMLEGMDFHITEGLDGGWLWVVYGREGLQLYTAGYARSVQAAVEELRAFFSDLEWRLGRAKPPEGQGAG
jgi:hypothetical protein